MKEGFLALQETDNVLHGYTTLVEFFKDESAAKHRFRTNLVVSRIHCSVSTAARSGG